MQDIAAFLRIKLDPKAVPAEIVVLREPPPDDKKLWSGEQVFVKEMLDTLARAIQNDGTVIKYVPPDFHMYEDLAAIAVRQSKYALGYIPKDHKCYQQMVQLQAERMAPPSPEHNYD